MLARIALVAVLGAGEAMERTIPQWGAAQFGHGDLPKSLKALKKASEAKTWNAQEMVFHTDGTLDLNLPSFHAWGAAVATPQSLKQHWFPTTNSRHMENGPKSYTTMTKNGKTAIVYSKKEMKGTAMPAEGDEVAMYVTTDVSNKALSGLHVKMNPVKGIESGSFLEVEEARKKRKPISADAPLDWSRVYQTWQSFGGGFEIAHTPKVEAPKVAKPAMPMMNLWQMPKPHLPADLEKEEEASESMDDVDYDDEYNSFLDEEGFMSVSFLEVEATKKKRSIAKTKGFAMYPEGLSFGGRFYSADLAFPNLEKEAFEKEEVESEDETEEDIGLHAGAEGPMAEVGALMATPIYKTGEWVNDAFKMAGDTTLYFWGFAQYWIYFYLFWMWWSWWMMAVNWFWSAFVKPALGNGGALPVANWGHWIGQPWWF